MGTETLGIMSPIVHLYYNVLVSGLALLCLVIKNYKIISLSNTLSVLVLFAI